MHLDLVGSFSRRAWIPLNRRMTHDMAKTQDATTDHLEPLEVSAHASLVGMRLWLDGSPLRVAGAWTMLAGLVAATGLAVSTESLLAVVMALLLADPIWGGMWAQVACRSVWPGRLVQRQRGWLPYANQSGPAGRSGLPGALLSEVLPLLLVALLVALLVSPIAVGLTLIVAFLCALGWLARRSGLTTVVPWLQVMVQVIAPFALGVSFAQTTPAWPVSASLISFAGGLTLLARADLAAAAQDMFPLLLAIAGSILVVGSSVIAGQPIAAGLLALLAAGPLFLLARPLAARRSAIQIWWWILAMTGAVALGIGFG